MRKCPIAHCIGEEEALRGRSPFEISTGNSLLRNSGDSQAELYNLAVDVGETQNVASDHPEVVTRLSAKLRGWESDLRTPLWGPGSPGFGEKQKKSKRKRSLGR